MEVNALIKEQIEIDLNFKKPDFYTLTTDKEKLYFIQPCFKVFYNFMDVNHLTEIIDASHIFLACALVKVGDTEYGLANEKIQERVDFLAQFDIPLLFNKYVTKFPTVKTVLEEKTTADINIINFIKNNEPLAMKGYVMLKAGKLPDLYRITDITWQFLYGLMKFEEHGLLDALFERLHEILGTKWKVKDIKELIRKQKGKKKITEEEVFTPLSLVINPDYFAGLGFDDKRMSVPKEESKRVMDANKKQTEQLIGKFRSLTG